MLFEKGKTGNPNGRPRKNPELVAAARALTPKALAALEAALSNPKERVQAAAVILDRGWGKAKQSVEHTGADGGPIQTQDVPVDTQPSIAEYLARLNSTPPPADAPDETRH